MATFGYQTKGSEQASISGSMRGSKFTLTEAGTVTKITVYLNRVGTDSLKVRIVIYDASYVKKGESDERVFTIALDDWYDFSASISLVAGDYWLVAWSDIGVQSFYDVIGTQIYGIDAETYNAAPNPWVPTLYDRTMSIYATYTPAVARRKLCSKLLIGI